MIQGRIRSSMASGSPRAAGGFDGVVEHLEPRTLMSAVAYQQGTGPERLVVIDATVNDGVINRNGQGWSVASTSGALGGQTLAALPNSGNNYATNYATTAPQANFFIDFAQPGTYYVWIRGIANHRNDDTVHVGLDGQAQTGSAGVAIDRSTIAWTSTNATGGRATITVATSGRHTLNLWVAEDGAYVDQILLTADAAYTPTGFGPSTSPRMDPDDGRIAGKVRRDGDGNRLPGPDEIDPGIGGVPLYLDLNENEVPDAGEPTATSSFDNPATWWDETGDYQFSHLDAGTYVVRQVLPDHLAVVYAKEEGPIDVAVMAWDALTGTNGATASVVSTLHAQGFRVRTIASASDAAINQGLEGAEVLLVPSQFGWQRLSTSLTDDGVDRIQDFIRRGGGFVFLGGEANKAGTTIERPLELGPSPQPFSTSASVAYWQGEHAQGTEFYLDPASVTAQNGTGTFSTNTLPPSLKPIYRRPDSNPTYDLTFVALGRYGHGGVSFVGFGFNSPAGSAWIPNWNTVLESAVRETGGDAIWRVTIARGELVQHIDFGNAIVQSPEPGTPDLLPVSDTGAANADNLTRLNNQGDANRLTFRVPKTIAGATVEILAGNVVIGSAVATGTTTDVVTNGGSILADGTHTITARQSVPNYSVSAASAGLAITVDSAAPTSTMANVSGRSTSPELRGTVSDAAATVVVRIAGKDYSATVRTDGTWILPALTISPALAAGSHDALVTLTDRAGNARATIYTGAITVEATTGAVAGVAWYDVDADGTRDAGEPVQAGVQVYLDTNFNNQFDTGERSATTSAAGAYSFAGLDSGYYPVRAVATEGLQQWWGLPPADSGTSLGASQSHVVDDARQRIYRTSSDGRLYVTDLATGEQVADVLLGGTLDGGLDLASDGKTLLVSGSATGGLNRVYRVDLDTLVFDHVEFNLDGGYFDRINHLAATSRGTALFRMRWGGDGQHYLWQLDVATGAVTRRTDVSNTILRNAKVLNQLKAVRSHDRTTVLFLNAQIAAYDPQEFIVYNALTDTFDARSDMSDSAVGAPASMSQNGTHYAVQETNGIRVYSRAGGSWTQRFILSATSPLFLPGRDVLTYRDTTGKLRVEKVGTWQPADMGPDGGLASPYPVIDPSDRAVDAAGHFYFYNASGDVRVTPLTGGPFARLSPDSVAATADVALRRLVDSPDLTDVSDTGASDTDDLTNKNNAEGRSLFFRIEGTVRGAIVRLYAGGVLVGQTFGSDGSTILETSGTLPLPDGVHVFTATIQELGLPESAASAALSVRVDTAAPTASVGGASTYRDSPPLLGTVSDPTATVSVSVDGTTFSNAVNNGDGTWLLRAGALPPLGPGTFDVTVVTVDPAGNETRATAKEALVIHPREIRGTKFHDFDRDGQRDANEPALTGQTIFIDADADGQLDDGERSVATDAQGRYAFIGLPEGTYRVTDLSLPGWAAVHPSPAFYLVSLGSADTAVTTLDFEDLAHTQESAFVGTYERGGFRISSSFNSPQPFMVYGPSSHMWAGSWGLNSRAVPVDITLSRPDGTPFDLTSIDWANAFPSVAVSSAITVTATRADGSTVSRTFSGTEGDFRAFAVSTMNGVASLRWRWTNGWGEYSAVDDIVLRTPAAIVADRNFASYQVPPFTVTSASITNGATLTTKPTFVDVNFSTPVRSSSLAASDLLTDGQPAAGVQLIDADTVRFTFPTLADGQHTYALADGSLTDEFGQTVAGYTATFGIDTVAPRLIYSSIQQNDVLATGGFTFTARFDQDLLAGVIDVNDVFLTRTSTSHDASASSFRPTSVGYDPATRTLTATFASNVAEGRYRLSLSGGGTGLRDAAGNALDGEPLAWPIPSNQTGNGVPGGSFTVDFGVDAPAAGRPVSPFARVAPLGSLVSRSVENPGYLHAATDTDDWRIHVPDGQVYTVVVRPPRLVTSSPSLTLAINGEAVAAPASGPVVVTRTKSGNAADTLTVGGAAAAGYTVEVYQGALVEATDSSPGQPMTIDASRLHAGPVRYAVIGTGRGAAESDAYAIDLAGKAGRRLDIVLAHDTVASFNSVTLQLLGPDGAVVATASPTVDGVDGTNFDQGVFGFVVPQDGVYTLRLTTSADVPMTWTYAVSVTEHAVLEVEPADPSAPPRSLDGTGQAIGHLRTPSAPQLWTLEGYKPAWASSTTSLTQLDPLTGNVLRRIPVPTGYYSTASSGLAFDGQTLYLTSPGNISGTNLLYKIDSASGQVIAVVDLGTIGVTFTPRGAAMYGGHLVLADEGSNRLVFLDPGSNAIVRTLTVAADLGSGLAGAQSRGSFFASIGQQTPLVVEIDAETGAARQTLNTGLSFLTGVAFIGGNVYAGNNGALARVDPNTAAVTPMPVAIGDSLSGDDLTTVPPPDTDRFTRTLQRGQTLTLATRTPYDAEGDPGNTLKVALVVRGPDGQIVAQSTANAADGRNATLAFRAAADGVYTIELAALAGSGEYVLDLALTDAAQVVGRRLFYNRSAFDGNSALANSADDGAVASDKAALLPGQTATFANYTSYSRGINGVMIDVAGLPYGGAGLDASDFGFRIGNTSTPGAWAAGPSPVSISVRTGAGAGGSDRVTLVWADGVIRKTWLQVTMKGNSDTGLAGDDVFYFGNAVGETGNSTSNAAVNALDADGVISSYSGLRQVPSSSHFDIDRNGRVNALDTDLVISNYSGLSPLRLITTPGVATSIAVAPTASATTRSRQTLVDAAGASMQSYAAGWHVQQLDSRGDQSRWGGSLSIGEGTGSGVEDDLADWWPVGQPLTTVA